MKYSLTLLLMAAVLVFSCRTVKKTQAIRDAFNKKDSSQTVVISESPAVDSAAIVMDILEKW